MTMTFMPYCGDSLNTMTRFKELPGKYFCLVLCVPVPGDFSTPIFQCYQRLQDDKLYLHYESEFTDYIDALEFFNNYTIAENENVTT